jgi:hypothetical protein
MKKTAGIIFVLASAVGVGLLWRRLLTRTQQSFPSPTQDSPQAQTRAPHPQPLPADSGDLVELNDADSSKLKDLGLEPESVERLVENRPYRSKLELISRMVLTEPEYELIREKVTVAQSQEPVKIAS